MSTIGKPILSDLTLAFVKGDIDQNKKSKNVALGKIRKFYGNEEAERLVMLLKMYHLCRPRPKEFPIDTHQKQGVK